MTPDNQTCTNCGKKRKIKADWCKCEHTNDVFVLEQRELDRIDEKFKAPEMTTKEFLKGIKGVFAAPENAGCGKLFEGENFISFRCGGHENRLCPDCKNAGDDTGCAYHIEFISSCVYCQKSLHKKENK